MKLKLGIAPIAWSNDDMPELGGDTPIEQCLEEASLAGLNAKLIKNENTISKFWKKSKISKPKIAKKIIQAEIKGWKKIVKNLIALNS